MTAPRQHNRQGATACRQSVRVKRPVIAAPNLPKPRREKKSDIFLYLDGCRFSPQTSHFYCFFGDALPVSAVRPYSLGTRLPRANSFFSTRLFAA
jgi:hypothetical protein